MAVATDSGKELWRYAFPFSVSPASTPIVGGKDGDELQIGTFKLVFLTGRGDAT